MIYRRFSHFALGWLLSLSCSQAGAIDDQVDPFNKKTDGGRNIETSVITDTAIGAARSDSDQQKAVRKKEKNIIELSTSKKLVRPGNAPCLSWLPTNGNPRAAILCVHGLGLHDGTYADFGQRMAELGYATYAIDVRGFGSFMEAKGRVDLASNREARFA